MNETTRTKFFQINHLPVIRSTSRNIINKNFYKIIGYNNNKFNDINIKRKYINSNERDFKTPNRNTFYNKSKYNIKSENKKIINLKLSTALSLKQTNNFSDSMKNKYTKKINYQDIIKLKHESICFSSENKKDFNKNPKLFLYQELNKNKFVELQKKFYVSTKKELCGLSFSTKTANNYILNGSIQNFNKPEIKNLIKHENIVNMNNFLSLLKMHLILDKKIDHILFSISNNSSYVDLLKLLNEFFDKINEISFEIDIFIAKEYNNLIKKISKIIIIHYSIIFIIICLFELNDSFNLIKTNFEEIRILLTFSLHSIFFKFITEEKLKFCKYINLDFVPQLSNITNNTIENNFSIEKIYNIIQQKSDFCIKKIINSLNNEIFKNISELINSIKSLLTEIINHNTKNLLEYIDIILNVILYTIIDKNIKKVKNYLPFRNYVRNTIPYLPEISKNFKYTLVLDMDETIGHFLYNSIKKNNSASYGYLISEENKIFLNNYNSELKIKAGIFLIRPYAREFLAELNKNNFEIVVFTAGTKDYCDKILDLLDIENNFIKYRLYRSHLTLRNMDDGVKDLTLLGRELNKVVIVDNIAENYKLQENNGLPIKPWRGEIEDMSLKYLLKILKFIGKNDINDIRKVVKKIKKIFNEIGEVNYAKIDVDSLL